MFRHTVGHSVLLFVIWVYPIDNSAKSVVSELFTINYCNYFSILQRDFPGFFTAANNVNTFGWHFSL